MKEFLFNDLSSSLLLGREIEFSYEGKRYSITNSDNRWNLCCDTDNNLLANICEYGELNKLVSIIELLEKEGYTLSEIFNQRTVSDIIVL